MNSISRIMGIGVLLLLSCSADKKTVSTEVENEIHVSSIDGVAATGYAMNYAAWEVVTSAGVRVAQGTTDGYGRFHTSLDTLVQKVDLPWLVRVMGSEDTLAGLLEADDGSSDTLFGLVNPISDYVSRRLLGPAVNDPFGGFQPPERLVINTEGQKVVDEVIGKGFQWDDFHRDRFYRPAVNHPGQGYIPSPNDMVIHSLGSEAARLGVNRKYLLDSLFRDSSFCAMAEKDFRLDVAANMALFGIPPDSARPRIDAWQKNQGIEDSSVGAYYMQMWEYGQGKEDGGPSGPADPLMVAMQAANMAMHRTAQTYREPELSIAWNNFNPGVVIISDLVYPFARDGLPMWRIQRLADNIGFVLSALNPIVWSVDSIATKSLAETILREYILMQDSESLISPDAIRTEVMWRWTANKPAFQHNPLRISQPLMPTMK